MSITDAASSPHRRDRSDLPAANRIWIIYLFLAAVPLGVYGCKRFFRGELPPFFFVDHVSEAEATFDEALFRSFRKNSSLSAPITLSADTRRSLIPPLPSRLSFTVQVPPHPALRFAIGASTLGEPTLLAPIEFRVLVDSGQGEKSLFSETVRRSQPNRWLDREADLSFWEGTKVRLVFETRPGGPSRIPPTAPIQPVWGNPVLTSSRRLTDKPDLILISIDTLRPDHLGTYGYPRATSPHIDQLAADGAVFETAVGTSSWTLPAHMSMLTGLTPSFHGVVDRGQKLASSVAYLPELLAQAGYETKGVASWVFVSQSFGFERGFHLYRVLHEGRAAESVTAALDLIRQAQAGPQFLFLHLFDPHWPYTPPAQFLSRFAQRPPDISDLLKVANRERPSSQEEIEQLVNLYDGEIAYLDRELGRLFESLKAMGLYDRSLILLTSDHGEAFYEHGHWQHIVSLYEEIVRLPLIVKWPGRSIRGRVKTLVSQVDIFPTLLEAAGLDFTPPGSMSLLRHFSPSGQASDPRMALSEIGSRFPRRTPLKISLRREDLKYVATLGGPPGDPRAVPKILREELYDLARDPGERKNLANGSLPDLGLFRREIRAYLEEARRLKASLQGEKVVLDEATRNRLRSLGYVDH